MPEGGIGVPGDAVVMTEPESERRPRGQLALEPSTLYAAKALYTHARSAWWQARRERRGATAGLRILAYHRVSGDRDELAVRPQRFREQMEYLAAAGFSVVGASEAAAAIDAPPRARTIGLTFDDGYRDVVEHALPVLAELGSRATVFVPTGAIDGTHPFSWYKRPIPLLDWATIVALDRGHTFDFGAHTVSHLNLLAVDERTAAREIADSKHVLETRLGHEVDCFCYPAGLHGERERELVRASGFRLAVGAEPGPNGPDGDRFALRRIGVGPRDRLMDFRAKVGGGHDSPPPLRGLYRQVRFGSSRASSKRS
jgi:peptidoglycan/xylan/chitin deacetylase (PgdA/CDA1 family)